MLCAVNARMWWWQCHGLKGMVQHWVSRANASSNPGENGRGSLDLNVALRMRADGDTKVGKDCARGSRRDKIRDMCVHTSIAGHPQTRRGNT